MSEFFQSLELHDFYIPKIMAKNHIEVVLYQQE